ncbi:unnamed protein product [Dibothriocephalus latus]|uniref:Uncharacterized protein n=1 Tax=Dibothriocephalus latus TaxID=60516 RepID=A0A3P6SG09_DIBLA|nr:unnamed protein product [Dibothriocephalus latus]
MGIPLVRPLSGLRSVDSASELFYEDAVKESSKPEEFSLKKPAAKPSVPSISYFYASGCFLAAGKWYSEILEEDSLKLEDMRHKVKDFALPGSYRHMLVKPEDVHYTIKEYTDPLAPLIDNDLKLLSSSPPSPSQATPPGKF